MYHIADYPVIFSAFREDDQGKVFALVKDMPLPFPLMFATAYSTPERRLSASMKRYLLELVADCIDAWTMILLADGLLNQGEPAGLPPSRLRAWLQNEFDAMAEFLEDNDEAYQTPATRQALLEFIETREPDQILTLLQYLKYRNEFATFLPTEVVVALAERIGRLLKDDRTYFFVLYSSCLSLLLQKYASRALAPRPAIEVVELDKSQTATVLRGMGVPEEVIQKVTHGETQRPADPPVSDPVAQPKPYDPINSGEFGGSTSVRHTRNKRRR